MSQAASFSAEIIPPADDERSHAAGRKIPLRQPAVPVAIAFAVGISVDRGISPAWTTWLATGMLTAGLWFVAHWRRRTAISTTALLVTCVAAGGARHHEFWSARQSNEIAFYAAEDGPAARVVGRVIAEPWIEKREADALRSAWPQVDRTHCLLECTHLETGSKTIPVSGRVRVTITGHALHVTAGDTVDALGMLARPRGPGNPGEFDFRTHLRRNQVGCVLYADHPDAIRRLQSMRPGGMTRLVANVRAEAERLIDRNLSATTRPIASALLLGQRGDLDDDIRTAFAESGMMHLLAISGLHVGILAGLLWLICRSVSLSPAATSIAILAIVAGYISIADVRPPIVRATVFLAVILCGRPWYRRTRLGNTLAIAALVILIWNPSDLCDPGAQLSFLSVMAMAWSMSLQNRRNAELLPLIQPVSWIERRLRSVRNGLTSGYFLVFAIWLFTVPLVAARFQLISPVGFVLNVFLVPVAILILWSGYAMLLFGLLIPVAAIPFGVVFDYGLRGLLWIVHTAADIRLGHFYIPAPPVWWLIGYYVLLAAALTCTQWLRKLPWFALATWSVIGLAAGLAPNRSSELRCTFLSVGHGCSVLLEMPDGHALLYDAGSISDGRRASQIVRGVLSERGISRLHAVMLSHADIDHFNGLPHLLRTVPIGSVLVSPTFLDFEQESVAELCRSAVQTGVPIQTTGRGDRLRLDKNVTLRILHPGDLSHEIPDNAASLVLSIEYAHRRILLTGDVEGEGISELIASPIEYVDVMLAPHHGSLGANTPELIAWAQPEYAVVSSGFDVNTAVLTERYGPNTQVLATGESGAVTVVIQPDGTLRVSTFRTSDTHLISHHDE